MTSPEHTGHPEYPEQGTLSPAIESLASVPFAGEAEPTQDAPEIIEFTDIPPDDETLNALKNFLQKDLLIKTKLLSLAPKELDDSSPEARIQYIDRLDEELRDFRSDFLDIDHSFGFNDEVTKSFFEARRAGLAVSHFTPGIGQQLYNQEFAQMRPDFVENVKKEATGYYMWGSALSLAGTAESVNEYLHAYHNHIMNSENILQKVPARAERKMNNTYPVFLRGEDSPVAREIFTGLPADLNVGDTDIVAAGGHIMMMLRDRGHALTIDITPAADSYELHYHIPKICNQPMVEALPGVGKVTPGGASGSFTITAQELQEASLPSRLAGFIAAVPTDDDMFKPGGVLYSSSN